MVLACAPALARAQASPAQAKPAAAPQLPKQLPKAADVAPHDDVVPNGSFAPDFSLARLDAAGGTFTLSDHVRPDAKGKSDGAIVAFMASWCGICQKSLPSLAGLLKEHGSRLTIVIVSTDATVEDAKKEAKKLADAGLAVPVVHGDAATLQAWLGKQRGVPKYFFVNKVGEVLIKDTGYGDKVAAVMPRQAAFTLAHPDPIAR